MSKKHLSITTAGILSAFSPELKAEQNHSVKSMLDGMMLSAPQKSTVISGIRSALNENNQIQTVHYKGMSTQPKKKQ